MSEAATSTNRRHRGPRRPSGWRIRGSGPLRRETLGPYLLGPQLGRGGMAIVREALDTRTGQRVAIKELRSEHLASPRWVSRFFEEARIMSVLDHPNLVELIDLIDIPGPTRRVAFVMELLEGTSLDQLVAEGPLPTDHALEISRQLAEALTVVHGAGVVHRDIKPANIIVLDERGADGAPQVKIVDFGIAKTPHQPRPHETHPGLSVGTPAYMAPEQATAGEISPATDVYAVGEVLFELLAGERAFGGGNDHAIVRRKLLGHFPRLPASDDPRRPAIERAIHRCMAPDPRRRPGLNALAKMLQDVEEHPRRPWWLAFPGRRRMAVAVAALTVSVGLAALSSLSLANAGEAPQAEQRATAPIERVAIPASARLSKPAARVR